MLRSPLSVSHASSVHVRPLRNGTGARLTRPTRTSTPVKDRRGLTRRALKLHSRSPPPHICHLPRIIHFLAFSSTRVRSRARQVIARVSIRTLCRNGAISWLVRSAPVKQGEWSRPPTLVLLFNPSPCPLLSPGIGPFLITDHKSHLRGL